MSSFTVMLLCIQACLVQNVFSSCVGYGAGLGSGLGLGAGRAITSAPCSGALNANYGLRSPAVASPTLGLGAGYGTATYGGAIGSAYGGALAPSAAYGGAIAPGAAYGGTGEGNVAVAGELPVAGNTAVAGQVPVIGVVNFGGAVPAAGAVTISGNCACGCGH